MPEPLKAYRAEPYAYSEARALVEELSVSEPVAITLVRRGYRTPEAARAFLAGDERHPPGAFDSMAEVVERILAAVRSRRRITVHGDFDVDGVCATAILVGALRRLGADCDWLIPDRVAEGYGLSAANVERLASRGASLLVTVDCGITAAAEVELAKSLGLEVIVTDHHEPPAELPACPILHPELCGYPFAGLCGAAVAWKLATALREEAGAAGDEGEEDLDLVALATVADVVPLLGENRSLVRRGLAAIRRTRRVGMRALLAAAGCEPQRLDEGDLAFRLGPRINAAGRLYRADAGVELFLTEDEKRAAEIAAELERANRERRDTERQVEAAAEAARRALPDRLREAPGLVLAGEGWHPGVIGIVASRLVERHHRPVVLVSLAEGRGRGSGRSIAGFDLLAGLQACSSHLDRFGGHRAAAGLELRAEAVEGFREAFAAHAAAALDPEDLRRTERIDAVVGGSGIGLDLAEELRRLGPFGMGNPGVRLLVPSARVGGVRAMGGGKHARFSLHSGGHSALGVAFGSAKLPVAEGEPVDAAVRLEVNHWNGSVEPRIVLRDLFPVAPGQAGDSQDERVSLHRCEADQGEWWQRLEAELECDPAAEPEAGEGGASARLGVREPGRSAVAVLAELLSSGAPVLAVCADASRRAALAVGPLGMARFNGGVGHVGCCRCPGDALEGLARQPSGLTLVDYPALGQLPRLPERFEQVVLVDPPASAAQERWAAAGGGYLHRVWGEEEREFAARVLDLSLAPRSEVAGVYRALREAGEAAGERLRAALAGGGPHPRSPEAAARCLRVLSEIGLVEGAPQVGAGAVRVVSSKQADLAESAAFRAYRARFEEGQRFLERRRQP